MHHKWHFCSLNKKKKNLNILQWIQKLHWQLVLMHFFPGQVDWAALAQAWIAQKESTGGEQQNIQPNGQDIPGLESVGQNNHSNFQGDPAFGRMWQPGTQLSLWAMALPLGKKKQKAGDFSCGLFKYFVFNRMGNAWPAPSSSTPWPGLDPSRVRTNGCGEPQRGQQQPGQRGIQLWSPPWGLPPEQPWVWGTARQLRHGPHGHEPVWLSGMQMLR